MHSAPFLFFFQAEDGIRDYKVTGVQTCALPISFAGVFGGRASPNRAALYRVSPAHAAGVTTSARASRRAAGTTRRIDPLNRSEERRVGKECRYRGGP